MKKRYVLAVLALTLVILLAGCAGKTESPESGKDAPAAGTAAPESGIKGELFESDKFSITVAKGWEKMDIDGGVQIYKMSGEAVQVYIRGMNMSDTEAKSQAESQSKQYSGTAPEEVERWGKSWWTTTYTAMDLEQLKYLRIESGQLVSVSAAAKDIAGDSDIQGMLESLTFK